MNNDSNKNIGKIILEKWHGLGNDFLIFDKAINHKVPLTDDFIKFISNRRIGIGCDQLIVLDENKIDFYNPDATHSEMCGNGTRCAAKYLSLQNCKNEIDLITSSKRVLKCLICENEEVEVDMGEVLLLRKEERGIFVDIGNPHLVCFDMKYDVNFANEMQEKYFKTNGVNVGFATFNELLNEIELKVHERGAGLTLACGTGACASVIAYSFLHSQNFVTMKVNMPGGSIVVTVKGNAFKMRGIATMVGKIII